MDGQTCTGKPKRDKHRNCSSFGLVKTYQYKTAFYMTFVAETWKGYEKTRWVQITHLSVHPGNLSIPVLCVAIKVDGDHVLWPGLLPRIAITQPIVWFFMLDRHKRMMNTGKLLCFGMKIFYDQTHKQSNGTKYSCLLLARFVPSPYPTHCAPSILSFRYVRVNHTLLATKYQRQEETGRN